jgi:hypothetical protein
MFENEPRLTPAQQGWFRRTNSICSVCSRRFALAAYPHAVHTHVTQPSWHANVSSTSDWLLPKRVTLHETISRVDSGRLGNFLAQASYRRARINGKYSTRPKMAKKMQVAHPRHGTSSGTTSPCTASAQSVQHDRVAVAFPQVMEHIRCCRLAVPSANDIPALPRPFSASIATTLSPCRW